MVFLVNRVCWLPQKIEECLNQFGIDYQLATEEEWYERLISSSRNNEKTTDIWVHVWDDHPFMVGGLFQDALRKKQIPGDNHIFAVWNDSYRLRIWKQQLEDDIRDKFGYMYSFGAGTIDPYVLADHIFLINSETGENFEKFALAISRLKARFR